ncbi:MAG TPA: hypothetical protein VNZ55_10530 [Thermomicrobiales bacterium]|nr:hypothetical protein [Thermomicrobiales bacterium]
MMLRNRRAPEREDDETTGSAPGESGLVSLGLAVGILFMLVQLWLLTLAFDLYLSGQRGDTVGVAIISGLVFLGGLLMLKLLQRRPISRG